MPQQLSPTSKDALNGAGIGSVAGLLTTLFQKNRTLKDYVKNTLIGGGVGAATGAGLGKLQRAEPSTPPPTSVPSKPKIKPSLAAISGLFPGLGPAIYGAAQSSDGDRLANALKLGGSSLAGGLAGGLAGNAAGLVGLGRGKPLTMLLGPLLKMIGSAGASGAAADYINKSASSLTDRFQQGLGSFKQSLAKSTVQPYNPMSLAAFGMIPGAVVGGGVGLLKSVLDDEDDGVMTTLGKILSGVGVGGLGGAALYGGASALSRNKLLSSISNPKQRENAARALSQFELPLDESRNIAAVNALAGADQITSPAVVNLLRRNNKQPQ